MTKFTIKDDDYYKRIVTRYVVIFYMITGITIVSFAFLTSHRGVPTGNTTTGDTKQHSPVVQYGKDGVNETICTLKDVVCPFEKEKSQKTIYVPQKAKTTSTVAKQVKNKAPQGVIPIHNDKISISKKVCIDKGFTTDTCWKMLYSMHMKETTGNCKAIGDQGRSYGCFQIQYRLHNVTKQCAYDYTCSAQWTLNHLVQNGYPQSVTYAIKRHNGDGIKADRYAADVTYRMSSLK